MGGGAKRGDADWEEALRVYMFRGKPLVACLLENTLLPTTLAELVAEYLAPLAITSGEVRDLVDAFYARPLEESLLPSGHELLPSWDRQLEAVLQRLPEHRDYIASLDHRALLREQVAVGGGGGTQRDGVELLPLHVRDPCTELGLLLPSFFGLVRALRFGKLVGVTLGSQQREGCEPHVWVQLLDAMMQIDVAFYTNPCVVNFLALFKRALARTRTVDWELHELSTMSTGLFQDIQDLHEIVIARGPRGGFALLHQLRLTLRERVRERAALDEYLASCARTILFAPDYWERMFPEGELPPEYEGWVDEKTGKFDDEDVDSLGALELELIYKNDARRNKDMWRRAWVWVFVLGDDGARGFPTAFAKMEDGLRLEMYPGVASYSQGLSVDVLLHRLNTTARGLLEVAVGPRELARARAERYYSHALGRGKNKCCAVM